MRRVLFILSELTDEDVDWLLAVGKRLDLAPERVLIRQGEQPDSLYLLVDGQLRVTTPPNRLLALLEYGEIAGEISFVDGRPASATVTSAGKATVLAIRRPDLENKLRTDLGFAARFFKAIAMFLSWRLRQSMAREAGGRLGVAEENDADELGFDMLDRLALAGKRSEWLLDRIRGRGK